MLGNLRVAPNLAGPGLFHFGLCFGNLSDTKLCSCHKNYCLPISSVFEHFQHYILQNVSQICIKITLKATKIGKGLNMLNIWGHLEAIFQRKKNVFF